MKYFRNLSGETWLLATAALAGLPHLFRAPWAISAVVVSILGYYFLTKQRAFPSPNKVARGLMAVGALALILSCHRTILGIESGISFLLLITVLKLFELKAKRDFALLVWLSSLLMIGELIFNQNLAATLFCFFGLGLSLHCLLLLSSMENLGEHAPSLGLGMKRVFVYSLPIVVIMFVVFPRVQLNLLGAITPGESAEIGFDDELRPGDVAKLATNEKVAFRVTFNAANAPLARDLYWRGAVLTTTDGINWLRPRRRFLPSTHKPPAYSIVQEIVLEPQSAKWLFALDRPALIVMAGEKEEAPLHTAEGIFESRQRIRSRVAYRAYSLPIHPTEALDEEASRRTMQMPRKLDPRIAKLGASLREEGKEPEQIAAKALDFFRTGGFEYTLAPGVQKTDSIGDFMFESKKGFCEHFASAFALLLRAAGVNSRVVVGFQGGSFNPYGGYFMVSFREAHAWVEAWLPNKGWVRMDPTAAVAPQRIGTEGQPAVSPEASEGLAEKIGQRMRDGDFLGIFAEAVFFVDNVNSKWNYFLVSYDLDFQKGVLARWSFDRPLWKVALFIVFGAVFLIFIVLWFAYRRHRPGLDPVLRAYSKLQQRLARKGINKLRSEGPLDFARRVQRELPEESEAIDRTIHLFIDLRYGAAVPLPEKIAELDRNVRKIA